MDYFIELGAGWFLFEDSTERLIAICDGLSTKSDYNFGPAAWGGKPGPVSGLTIAEAQPLARGQWEQTGEEEWLWFAEEDRERKQGLDEEPEFWPCQIVLKDSPLKSVLESIAGRTVASQDELVALFREITANFRPCMLPATSADARMAAAKFRHPHIFGEVDEGLSNGTH